MYLVSGYLFNIIALHSMINALSILFNIAPYRKAVTNCFKRILRIKERQSITIKVTEYSGKSITSLPRK
uniref:Uncharacterized protein n=1 Tax=Panagrolaimus davidi TaxID=227884 RepID=A0A914R7Y1_9BILA